MSQAHLTPSIRKLRATIAGRGLTRKQVAKGARLNYTVCVNILSGFRRSAAGENQIKDFLEGRQPEPSRKPRKSTMRKRVSSCPQTSVS